MKGIIVDEPGKWTGRVYNFDLARWEALGREQDQAAEEAEEAEEKFKRWQRDNANGNHRHKRVKQFGNH